MPASPATRDAAARRRPGQHAAQLVQQRRALEQVHAEANGTPSEDL
jgi:hypothetical protein